MNDFNIELLELVEFYAEENNLIASEEQLSELFDSEIAPLVIAQFGENDQDAINQAFNDWADGLCKDHQLHQAQYETYTYTGEFSA